MSRSHCNRGPGGKFGRVPSIDLLARLHTRNEFLIESHHPLRDTLIRQAGSTPDRRQQFLQRRHSEAVALLIHGDWRPREQWAPRIGVEVADWRIRRMRTRWGSCSTAARRIWLNLELAKKSDRCVEYIVVHELCHLIERTHNDRFRRLMDRHLPSWQTRRDELNRTPLAYEDWTY